MRLAFSCSSFGLMVSGMASCLGNNMQRTVQRCPHAFGDSPEHRLYSLCLLGSTHSVACYRYPVQGWMCCTMGWRCFQKCCYYILAEQMSWNESKDTSTGLGSHMVVIDTEANQVGGSLPIGVFSSNWSVSALLNSLAVILGFALLPPHEILNSNIS